MPSPPHARNELNPWPTWPLVYRVSTSHAEGGERRFSFLTQRFEGEAGKVTALIGREIELTLEGGETQIKPIGDEIRLPCDLVLLAMGFTVPMNTSLERELGVPLDDRGRVLVDDRRRSLLMPLYVAGDVSRGASLIVWAISDGVEVARAVDEELRGRSSIISRGSDAPFTQ